MNRNWSFFSVGCAGCCAGCAPGEWCSGTSLWGDKCPLNCSWSGSTPPGPKHYMPYPQNQWVVALHDVTRGSVCNPSRPILTQRGRPGVVACSSYPQAQAIRPQPAGCVPTGSWRRATPILKTGRGTHLSLACTPSPWAGAAVPTVPLPPPPPNPTHMGWRGYPSSKQTRGPGTTRGCRMRKLFQKKGS